MNEALALTLDEALDMIDHLKAELRAVTHDELHDPDTATVEELCRPISADVTTRRNQYFGYEDAPQSKAGKSAGMAHRMNQMRRGK